MAVPALPVTLPAPFTLIPGLTQTVTVPANGRVFISTHGGVQTQSTSASGFSFLGIEVLVDGALEPDLAEIVDPANTPGVIGSVQNWALMSTVFLSPGQHTISVIADGGQGSPAIVGGGGGSFLQPSLTVTILNT